MRTKILLVSQNWVGDALFQTPALRAIRKKYPKSHIACLMPRRCEPIFRNNPHLNEILLYEERASWFSLSFWQTLWRLRSKKFTTAVFFHGSATKTRLAALAGIAERVGYPDPKKKRNLTLLAGSCVSPHKIDYFLGLAKALGAEPDGRWMDFLIPQDAETKLRSLLLENGVSKDASYAVVHPGGNWDLKRWPVPYFTEWCRQIHALTGWTLFLCGTPSEKNICDQIASQFSKNEVRSLCGLTDIDTLAALLKGAKVFLSNDSGPIHLAASQKTPLVGLFGPTSDKETGPVGLGPIKILKKDVGCQVPCYFRRCDHRVCMELLTPEQAVACARELISL